MSAINMTPEAIDAVNKLLDERHIDGIISDLNNAEEALQKAAYDDETDHFVYMFRYAYELKLIREEFEKLEEILGYEPKRD